MANSPPKQYLSLIFFILISFSFVFLFSLLASNRKPRFQTQIEQIPTPGLTFIIKVLTYNRVSSLSRCLNSLSKAHYDIEDKVHLHVFIDHFRQDSGTPSAETDQNLKTSKQILDFVDGFNWVFGEKVVHYRTSNAGLQAQWLESWWPSSDHEFAFVVEDDLEVSPLYYRFLKALILNYYYNSSNFSPSVYGASLQRARFVPGKHGNKIKLDGESRVFLYQLVGTWGQLLFPRPWKEFRLWYDLHRAKDMKPFLEGMVTTGWYNRMGEKIWTPWFIKFIHSIGYFNLYTNFHNNTALSISHRDAGVSNRRTAGPDSHLIYRNSINSDFLELPPLNNLKWYDFCFREIITNRIIRSSSDLGSVIQSFSKNNSIVLVSLYRAHEKMIRNMLCHFERLNIRNYILIGPSSDFLLDLSRRGHAVIDATRFSDYTQFFTTFRDSDLQSMEEIVVSGCAIKKSLELGFNTCFLDGHLLPLNNDSFFDLSSYSDDEFYISKRSGIVFLRSSVSLSKIWTNEFIYSIAYGVKRESASHDGLFPYVVEKLLEKKKFEVKNIDEMKLGLEISSANNVSMMSLLSKTVRFVYWYDRSTDFDKVQKRIEQFGLWVIDAESSCTAVVCQGP